MSFPLVGNSKIQLAIENTLKEHRLPHAILIDGDIGTGRHTLANYLSLAAVCSGNDIPCSECKNCKMANSNNHPDITVIAPKDGKKNIAVDQIRVLKADCFIKPHQANSRVFIIDFADTMNERSQNALLKILEEPPGNTFFILIAESKASFLETIISRCAILSLNTPTLEDGVNYILQTYNFELEDIQNALQDTKNNIGKAIRLLKGKADTKTSTAAKEFLACMLRGNEWGMLEVLNGFEKNRVEADRLFKDLKYYITEEIKKNPQSYKAAPLTAFYSKLQELETSLVTNINLSLLFADLTAQAKKVFT